MSMSCQALQEKYSSSYLAWNKLTNEKHTHNLNPPQTPQYPIFNALV